MGRTLEALVIFDVSVVDLSVEKPNIMGEVIHPHVWGFTQDLPYSASGRPSLTETSMGQTELLRTGMVHIWTDVFNRLKKSYNLLCIPTYKPFRVPEWRNTQWVGPLPFPTVS